MPEKKDPVPITIYVKPYVLKYVVHRLCDPERVYFDAGSRQLWSELQAALRGRELCAVRNTLDMERDRPSQRLTLMVRPGARQPADISYWRHRYVTGLLTKAYLQEMCDMVDWHTGALRRGVRQSLELFRRHYGVSEDDHALHTAERIYRYRRKRKR